MRLHHDMAAQTRAVSLQAIKILHLKLGWLKVNSRTLPNLADHTAYFKESFFISEGVSNLTCFLAVAHLHVKEAPVLYATFMPDIYIVFTANDSIIPFTEGLSLKTRILIRG